MEEEEGTECVFGGLSVEGKDCKVSRDSPSCTSTDLTKGRRRRRRRSPSHRWRTGKKKKNAPEQNVWLGGRAFPNPLSVLL